MMSLTDHEAAPPAVGWGGHAREKQIKAWLRRRKVALIESVNPDWRDLSEDWSRTA